ncbi:MAG TPA: PTS sugar transporter subunit IIA [Lentibacillus sp.]|nr:PTS sugar transporter subunit IIA [Lentibacillus sp.]
MYMDKQFIFVDLEVNSREEVLTLLGDRLYKLGYVKKGFTESVIEREKHFPTGLPAAPYGIAIPHTDGDEVIQSKLVFASLKHPVQFMLMGDSEQAIQVSLVMMMALETGHGQIQMLQKIMGVFQNEAFVHQLKQTKKIDQIRKILDLS